MTWRIWITRADQDYPWYLPDWPAVVGFASASWGSSCGGTISPYVTKLELIHPRHHPAPSIHQPQNSARRRSDNKSRCFSPAISRRYLWVVNPHRNQRHTLTISIGEMIGLIRQVTLPQGTCSFSPFLVESNRLALASTPSNQPACRQPNVSVGEIAILPPSVHRPASRDDIGCVFH